MDPEDLTALRSIFTFKGIITELANPAFTDNLSLNEKETITNLTKATLAELRYYKGSNKDIKSLIQSILTHIPDLQRFNPTIS